MGNISWHNLEARFLVERLVLLTHQSFFLSPVFLISCVGFVFLLLLVRWLYILRKSYTTETVLLELTPPSLTEKTSFTTTQLFSVVHELGKNKTIRDKVLGKKTVFSFEIVSSLQQGIRYLIRTPLAEENNVRRSALAYLPQVSVKRVEEYLQINTKGGKVFEFQLDKHFAYPLQKQNILEEYDPIAYITGMMTKLTPGEMI